MMMMVSTGHCPDNFNIESEALTGENHRAVCFFFIDNPESQSGFHRIDSW